MLVATKSVNKIVSENILFLKNNINHDFIDINKQLPNIY